MAKKEQVLIIILNWNGRDDTLQCLGSLSKMENKVAEPTVVLVDNHSTDDSVVLIKQKYGWVDLIVNDDNLGFPAGNNVAIRKYLDKDYDWFLLLNNDTTITPDFLDKMVQFGRHETEAGIIGATQMLRRGYEVYYEVGGLINMMVGRTTPRETRLLADQKPQKVHYVSGACMLIKKVVFQKIGLLDEPYFFGFEDIDFCLEARRAGFEVYCLPEAVIEHKGSASIGQRSPLKIYYDLRNNLRFINRQILFPRNLLAYFYALLLSGKIVLNNKRNYKPVYSAWMDFFSGKFGRKVVI
jgi:GT2 family glycosyltransferase